MRYLYSALFYILFPFIVLRMLLRSRRAPAYRRRLAERFGVFTPDFEPGAPVIWLHAVSVGEVLATAPLIEDLLRDYPAFRLVLTTTTPTGSERARALFGDRVFHVYSPWDMPGAVRRFLHRVRPRLLVVMETELWPNLIHYSAASGCRVILANARLSERSAHGYARFARLTRPMLQQLDKVACQGQRDAGRFLGLGLPRPRLQITGNIKFDLVIDAGMRDRAAALRLAFGADSRPILLAASTHPGEEELILAAFKSIRQALPDCLLVLAPRHPERFEAVYSLVARNCRVSRRSACDQPVVGDEVFLLDSMGELGLMFSVARVALIGGSLVEHGGHNPLEAAAWGVPVVCGPHMFNFSGVSELLVDAGAMMLLEHPEQLGACLLALLNNEQDCQARGKAAMRVLDQNRGARERLLELVAQQLADGEAPSTL